MVSVNDDDLNPAEAELVNHCTNGTLCDLSGRPADEVRVRAEVIYELCVGTRWPVHAKGVQLAGARLEEPLDFEYAALRVPLTLRDSAIASIRITNATAPAIQLVYSEIGEELDAEMVRVRQLSLRGSTAEALSLADATIDGHLDLIGTTFTSTDPHGHSLTASGLYVTDAYLRDGFVAAGPITLVGAHIRGHLEMDGATLGGTDDYGASLIADGLYVTKAFLRHGFTAAGSVRLVGATVDRELDFSGAMLSRDTDGNSLNADRLHVGGGIAVAHGFVAAGAVRLVGATIDGRLHLHHIAGIGDLRLTDARCEVLGDDQSSWPATGRLWLRGFRFGALDSDADFKKRLEWVQRQSTDEWSTDPYEQLAAFYSTTGDERAARRMRIAKNDDELTHLRRTKGMRSFWYRSWRRLFGWLVGYGYRRWPAGLLLVVIVLAAGGFFRWAERDGAMVPNDPAVDSAGDPLPCGQGHPCFNSWVYAMDVVLPIIDFGQDDAWRPVETSRGDQWWIFARWLFIAVGWPLTAVFVAAFTALVQRS